MTEKEPIIVTRSSQFGDAIRQGEREGRPVVIETGWRTWLLRKALEIMYRGGQFANKPKDEA